MLFGLFFYVLQLLPIRFTQQDSCCVGKFKMKHMQNPYWKSDLIWFSYDYRKHVFVDFRNEYIKVLPIMFNIECRVVISIRRCIPISFKYVSLWCLLFDLHRTTNQSNLGYSLGKRATWNPSTLVTIEPVEFKTLRKTLIILRNP